MIFEDLFQAAKVHRFAVFQHVVIRVKEARVGHVWGASIGFLVVAFQVTFTLEHRGHVAAGVPGQEGEVATFGEDFSFAVLVHGDARDALVPGEIVFGIGVKTCFEVFDFSSVDTNRVHTFFTGAAGHADVGCHGQRFGTSQACKECVNTTVQLDLDKFGTTGWWPVGRTCAFFTAADG